ncbi:hypothetical protein NF701_09015 [Sphingomonadaceae bacterium OTU29THOMA1]|nr:hypothetical protein NF701_09015 [Sphingomonadaceae bacterium OTU29THOMA1]
MSRRIERADLGHLAARSSSSDETSANDASWRILACSDFLRDVGAFITDNPAVSTRSRFRDCDWWLDVPPPASASAPVISFYGIPEQLAAELKVAVLVAIGHLAQKRLSILTAINLGRGLALVGSWMDFVGLTTISHLGEGSGELFLEAFAEFADQVRSGTHDPEGGDWDPGLLSPSGTSKLGKSGLSTNMVRETATALFHLHEAGHSIEELTGARIRARPFLDDTAEAVAARWTKSGSRTTERLPDAVVERLTSGAVRLMGKPAADVIRIVEAFVENVRICDDRELAARTAMQEFEFAVLPGEDRPWFSSRHTTWYARLIGLVHRVRDAAALLVMLTVGMRPQEFIGLMGGSNADPSAVAALPRCVTEEVSKSGFSTLYLLHGHVFKRGGSPRAVSWLLGGRQAAGPEPAGLLALRILDALHRPLRAFATDGADSMLIVDFAGHHWDREKLSMVHCTSHRLAHSMRFSISFFSDLASMVDEEAGRDIRRYKRDGLTYIALYQLRKTYAQRLYQLDHRLLGAISRQLQHRCPTMTKKVYVTQDPEFRRELHVGRSRQTSLLSQQVLDGVVSDKGTMAASIDALLGRLGSMLEPSVRDELWKARLGDAGGLFGSDRLRPTAGMASVMRAELDGAGHGVAGDGEPCRSAAALRAFAGERRRRLQELKAGRTAAGREARERMLEAARWLNGHGFRVGDIVEDAA